MLIEMMKTQDLILERLERIARHVDTLKPHISKGKK
jgi:hypothetical protein